MTKSYAVFILLQAIVSRMLWSGVAFGATVGGIQAVFGFYSAESAPQQAVAAAMGCMCAIVPYVVARAFDQITAISGKASA